jgi:ribonuclease J
MSIANNSETTRPLHPDAVRILPLGGLGEIGLNMMVIEAAGGLLIIDCGLMFPEAYMLGIDLVIPDVDRPGHPRHRGDR